MVYRDSKGTFGRGAETEGAEIERQNEQQVRELLGADWNRDAYLEWVFDPYHEFFLGFLPREKAIAIQSDLDNLDQTAQAAFKRGNVAPKADYQELERLSRQLKSRLSPAEYAELNLRFLATSIHPGGFPDVQVNGTDARYIVALYAKHLDFIDFFLRRPEWDDLNKKAKAAVQEDIRNYLGPDRYVAFQRAEDLGYLWLHEVALDAGLSPDIAKRMFNLKVDASRQALAISENDSLAAGVRSQQLKDLRNSYRTSVTQLLGEDRAKEYAYRWGAWWENLGATEKDGSAK